MLILQPPSTIYATSAYNFWNYPFLAATVRNTPKNETGLENDKGRLVTGGLVGGLPRGAMRTRPLIHQIGDTPMAKNERTSQKMGQLASQVLRNPRSSATAKSLAASVLTQRPDHKKK